MVITGILVFQDCTFPIPVIVRCDSVDIPYADSHWPLGSDLPQGAPFSEISLQGVRISMLYLLLL